MGVALHDLQGGVEDGVVDGGGGLADAAAGLVHGGAAGVDGSGEIALVGGTASGGVVVGEFLAGHQDHAVAGLSGQLHVELPVGGAAHLAGTLPQQVGKEPVGQYLLGDVGLSDGEGDLHGLSLLGLLEQALGLGGVKVHPHGVGQHLAGIRIDGCVGRLSVQLPVDGLEVRLLRSGIQDGELDRVRLTLGQELSVGRLHRLLRSLAVHRAVGVPLYQVQGARLQVCGVAILAAAAAQGTVSGLELALQLCTARLCQLDLIGTKVLGSAEQVAQVLGPPGEEAAASHRQGRLGQGGGVHLKG